MSDESLFRSAAMSLVQVYIPTESVHETVHELGELGHVQFRDLNPDVTPFQRTFVAEIRRLDEMERRLQFLQTQLEREAMPARPLERAIPFLAADEGQSGPMRLEELARRLQEHESRVAQMNGSHDALQRRLLELEEAKHVIHETEAFFQQAETQPAEASSAVRVSMDEDVHDEAPLLTQQGAGVRGMDAPGPVDVEFVAGTVERSQMATLERVLWRALRGNLYMNYAEIQQALEDPSREEPVYKNVFVIFAHGAAVLSKIRKICESMGGTLYPVASDPLQCREHLRQVLERIEDHENILYSTNAARRAELVRVA